jgi:AbiTii-like protein
MDKRASVRSEDLANTLDSLPLSQTLPLALRLARDLNIPDFEKWLRLEISGYFDNNPALTSEVKVPEYRNVAGQHVDKYGRVVRVQSTLQFLNSIPLRNGIAELEKMATGSELLTVQNSVSIEFIRENFNVEVYAFQFSPLEITGVLGSIKLKLSDWLYDIQNPQSESPKKETFMYNLTSKHKELLQWVVQNVRAGELNEEFTFVKGGNGDVIFVGHSARNISKPLPDLSTGALQALMGSGLILVEVLEKGKVHCTLLGKAYEAVDSNFSQTAEKPKVSTNNSIFGVPNPRYTYDAFVLMPFTQDLTDIYNNHIKKVVDALDLSIARADDFFSQEAIMDEIWSAIANATFLIADCTGKNPNVFYEIGLAHAIGKPVILITQNSDDVPFDIRHRRYIKYAYTPPGMEKFEKDLSTTISEILKT